MWRGLLKLTWLEIKIFLREPLGALGTVLIPVVVFVGARAAGWRTPADCRGARRHRAIAPRRPAGVRRRS